MKSFDKKLRFLAGQLDATRRQHLLSYAEFLLYQQHLEGQAATIQTPEDIPRPANESVVSAMKRLAKTYSMLNNDNLLHEAAGLMSEHVMQGRDAATVIDDLEILFQRHYDAYVQNMKGMLHDPD